jgi:guanosine-3',5'-bis(diphosphate) 3'-pyrophosphohydrolase
VTTITARTRTQETIAFLVDAYRGRLRRSGKRVEHSLAVARLLRDMGQARKVVIAGLLHDLLEDTTVSPGELRTRFGSDITQLVQALTEDPSIEDHRARKAALRRQVLAAGRQAATIAVADKTAKLSTEDGRPSERRLEHYRATLEGVERRYGRSRLSRQLREELARCDPPRG